LHVKEKPPAHSNDAHRIFEKSMDFMKKRGGENLTKKPMKNARKQRILATKNFRHKFATSLRHLCHPLPRKRLKLNQT
jgi:hypothetical protein